MSHEPEEILLSAEQLSTDFRQLKRGDIIQLGDLFQEPHKTRTMTAEGMRFRFLRVVPDTFVNGVEIADIVWQPGYPTVVRALPKQDPFAEVGEDARDFFCRASKDMIRGELIAVRVCPDGTLASDKLDFSTYNAARRCSVASMNPTEAANASERPAVDGREPGALGQMRFA